MTSSPRRCLPGDWYPGGIPENIDLAEHSYVESADSFAGFNSRRDPGLTLGEGAGAYVGSYFIVGERGLVTVGDFSVINGASIICNQRVSIGAFCLVSWNCVVTDTWIGDDSSQAMRSAAMEAVSRDPLRRPPLASASQPVTIEDNVWVGFGAVILPGVTLRRGCVIGCRSVIRSDVEAYTVVVGDPPRVVKRLVPDDTNLAVERSLRNLMRADPKFSNSSVETHGSPIPASSGG